MADPSQIHQILMNLCANANHAMRERGGVLTIKLNHVTVDEDTARRTGTPKSGEYELLEVVDTGRGMDARTLDRIFDPYFTTKAPGEGTGLGMAVVKGIVESHEGWIGVASEPGKGTTVSVYLPCTQMPKPTASEQSKEDYSGQARVLVVDDESAIMAVETSILQHLGYNVTACLKSTEALQIFLARPDDFDLVVTDQTMPGMTGIQLIKEVHALRPNMPVVLCTGYSDQVSKESAQQHGITEFLSKPLSVSTLGKAVKQALSKRPTPIGKKLQPQRHGDAEQ
jgi:CheY-like chemotaxis protein